MVKKILFITAMSSGGGAERVMTLLSNDFALNGYNVTYASLKNNGYYDILPEVNKAIIGDTVGNGKIKLLLQLRKYLKDNSFDAIIAFGYSISIKIALASIFLPIRKIIIMSERNDPSQNVKGTLKKYLRIWAYSRASNIVFQTEDAQKYFPRNIQKKGAIIQNPINVQLTGKTIDPNSKRIIAVGRITPQKNFPMLVRAFSIIHKKHPEYVLHIYGADDGSGEKERLTEIINELNLNESVQFKGFSDNIIDEFYKSCMYVSSSIYEGISNSMLEAMSCGLPVICTDCPIGGARMTIQNNVNGLLVKVGDVDGLAQAMSSIIENEDFARSMGLKANEIAKTLSIDNIANQWNKIVEKL